MRSNIITIILIAVVISCTGDKNNFTVSCIFESSGDQQIYLSRRTLSGSVKIDSVMPDKSGTYVLKGSIAIPDFFVLYFEPDQYINLIIHPGDRISLNGDIKTFDYQYFVEGSEDSRLVQKMVARQALTLRSITEISREYEESRGLDDFEMIKAKIDSTYERIVAEHRAFSIELIEENPASLASLMALYQQLGRNIPVFDYQDDFQYYEMVDSSLAALYPGSEAVKDLNRKVTEIRQLLRIATGSLAPEIAIADTTGTLVSLSSLRGKYVLLYFWASWSPESIEQNKVLTALYSKYANQGLEYYQVSLDRTNDSWIQSLRQEQPEGIQVSDLEYWDSPVVEQYLLANIPEIYLLDQEGRIADKGFSADEFDEKFTQILINK